MRDTPTRRNILQIGAGLAALGSASAFSLQLGALGSAAAQVAPGPYRALVCIFLFGGNDTNNMVLATDNDSWGRYWSARNTGSDPIALMPVGTAPVGIGQVSTVAGRTVDGRDDPAFWGGVLPISTRTANPIPAGTNASVRTFGIHPLMGALAPIYAANRLAVLSNVGPLIVPTTKAQYRARSVRLPAGLMSHNDQQSVWQAGAAEGARQGWGGLMADRLLSTNTQNPVFTAISAAGNAVFLAGGQVVQYQVTTNLTPALRITPAVGSTLNGSSVAAARLQEILRETAGPSLFSTDYATVTGRSMDSAGALNAAVAATNAGVPAIPQFVNPITGANETNSLATQLQTIARMIAANSQLGLRRQVFFVSLGGWDTHDFQNGAQGANLARVAHAMAYFDTALGNINGTDFRQSVTTFTASDFSRTFTTNGDGTDHAWGSHQFIMGGAVQGGDVYGQYPTLGIDQGSFQNPDMSGNILVPTTSVDQYAATLGRWLGVSDTDLDAIFPNLRNFATRNLGFV
jgi:uncharacterized protein (DUF1501 family)